MRTWHRSAMVWIGSSPTAATPSRALSTGVTANGSGSISRTANVTSVMRDPGSLLARESYAHHVAALVQHPEELIYELANLLTAVESVPQHPQPADELIARVDGQQIAARCHGLLVARHLNQ